MPIYLKKDIKGDYFRWGNHGKKYYFNNNSKISKKNAYHKAVLQARAAYANGYREKS
jgi:hypothetical protein